MNIDLANFEDEFFQLDHETNTCIVELIYNQPSDIFDLQYQTKMPLLKDDFLQSFRDTFELVPKRFKIKFKINFLDLAGFKKDNLDKIFEQNLKLEFKRSYNNAIMKARIAYSLIVLGLIFFISMILIKSIWDNGGIPSQIVSYILDIATTVTFWEALSILVVQNKEKRLYLRNLTTRLIDIKF